jgi:dTDP-4-dehydrorhamnose reductase
MRVVLTGASGQLGCYVAARLTAGSHQVSRWSGTTQDSRAGVQPVDLSDPKAVEGALADSDPDAIVHLGAITSVEGAYRDPERARVVNVAATAQLADWCASRGRRLVYSSTDLVFAGGRSWSRENDTARPSLTYGRTKLDAESAVLVLEQGLVLRMSLLFGPSCGGRPTYLDRTVAAWRQGLPQSFFEDEYRTPLDLATAAEAIARLLESSATGIVHVGGRERLSRFELARRVAVALGIDPILVRANRQADVPSSEHRPADVSLDTAKLAALLPELERPTVERAAARLWA